MKARTTALLVSLATILALLVASPSAVAADRDCGDFDNQKQAQIFFLKKGGPDRDPHRLDADHDGIACESNPCPCSRRKHLSVGAATGPVDRRRSS